MSKHLSTASKKLPMPRANTRWPAGLLPLLLLSLSGSVAAANWATQPGSTLGFTGNFQGETFAGQFAKFNPQIRFDPAHLAQSRFSVGIDLASANTRNQERDDMLRTAEFFNSRKQAQSRYVATKFRALGGNRFVADGVLTLNGVSKPVPLAFTWTAGAKPVLAGEANIKRLDFSVGTGEWTDTDLLPNEVKVKTRLLLAPVALRVAPAAAKAAPAAVRKPAPPVKK